MNILLINHYAGAPKYGMEYRPYYLSREWAKKGHRTQVVAASYSHVRTRQPKVSGVFGDEIIDDVSYKWFATPIYSGNGVSRVRNILTFLWRVWRKRRILEEELKPDVVIASSTYPMDIWPAYHIARSCNARLVYEVHDLWPLSPIELGGMSRAHPFIVLCQLAEDFAYHHADKVVSMLPLAKPYMESRGMDPSKFHYISNGVSKDEWENMHPLPENIKAKLRGIQERGLPVVAYAGSLGLANALDSLLDAARLGAGQFEVVIVGVGPEQDRLAARITGEGLTNVTLLPAVPKKAIPCFLEMIDIAYIGLLPQPLFRFGISPNKLIDYMMAGKPIVMAIDSGNDPVGEVGCGVTVSPGDPGSIFQGIMELVNTPSEERNGIGRKGRRFVLENQTYPVLAQRFLEVMGGE